MEAIGRGEYTPGAPFITERRLCEQFGVSTTTAVRVLNDLVADGVLIRHRGKGTFVAEGRPPTQRQSAARAGHGSDPAIACILQGHNRYETQLLSGLEDASTELGYRIFLNYTGGLAEQEDAAIQRAVRSDASGIVLYPVEGSVNRETLAEMRRLRLPIVMLDRYLPDAPTDAVVADNVSLGYRVTSEIIKLGHERIAVLWNETACTSVRDRLTGHNQALVDHNLAVRPELTVLRPYVRRSGTGSAGTLDTLLALREPPTMLLCSNGYVLAQVAEDLAAMGISLPGSLDLAGMDDAGPFDILPLTAVAGVLPGMQMGREAIEQLHARIGSAEPYLDVRHRILPIGIRTRAEAPAHLRIVAD